MSDDVPAVHRITQTPSICHTATAIGLVRSIMELMTPLALDSLLDTVNSHSVNGRVHCDDLRLRTNCNICAGFPPAQTRLALDSASQPWQLCLSVFADSPRVTTDGILHLRNFSRVSWIYLKGVQAYSISDAVLDSLHGFSELDTLVLGDEENPQNPPETNVTAAGVTRSVRLHTLIQVVIYALKTC